MKRALHGMIAYGSILKAELPAKTKTYTPINHADIINKVRREIRDAGFVIKGENYKSSNEGKIAVGSYKLQYKSDPDVDLCANFVNSYNKQYAFRFNLGGICKHSGNAIILNDTKMGAYKRVHKGDADILAEGKISEFISDAGVYWDTLIEHKAMLKEIRFGKFTRDLILGKIFYTDEILNGLQMNIISKELKNPSFDYKVDADSAWALYNHISLALKESRPATWIPDQQTLHQSFDEIINFDSKERGESIIGLKAKRFFTTGALEKRDLPLNEEPVTEITPLEEETEVEAKL